MNRKFLLFLVFFITLIAAEPSLAAYSTIPYSFRRPLDAVFAPSVYQYYDNDTSAGIKSYGCGSKTYNNHKGTDFNTPVGTPVYASAPGGIYQTYNNCQTYGSWESTCGSGYGNHVRIDHEGNTTDGVGLKTIYAHFKLNNVTVQKNAACGTYLGQSGSSGKSTAPHLHFEVQKYGYPKDDPFKGNCSGPVNWWTALDANGFPKNQCQYTW